MTVPRLDLDTLTWEQLVALGRERLAPESARGQSGPRWTLHGPVDPGVTLLEVLAWQLEQRLFIMDQEPDGVIRNILALLGAGTPHAALPAVTVLSLAPEGTQPVVVPAASVVEPDNGDPTMLLSTDHSTTLVPGLLVDAVDSPLASGTQRHVGDESGEVVVISLRHGVTGPPPSQLSVFVEVEPAQRPRADQDLDDEWLEPVGWMVERGAKPRFTVLEPNGTERNLLPPPTHLVWSAEAAGRRDVVSVSDGTGGLRHSGVLQVRLTVDIATRWARGSKLIVRAVAEAPTFSFPPFVRAVRANAVVARSEVARQVTGTDGDELLSVWNALPGQTLEIPGAAGSLVDRNDAVTLTLVEDDGEEHDWRAVADLHTARPGDRVFEIDRSAGALLFGDGRHGRIPRPSVAPSLRLAYALGGGDVEGVAAGAKWRLAPADHGASAGGPNVLPLGCGAQSETLGAARSRAAQDVQRNRRLVTPDDHVDLAMRTPGVDLVRAALIRRLDMANPCSRPPDAVTVVCVPRAPRGPALAGRPRVSSPQLDPGAAEAVRHRFANSRLIGSFVDVTGPRYRRIRLMVDIASGSTATDPREPEIRSALVRFLDPVDGDIDGTGWPVGRAIAPADLLVRAQRAAGPGTDVVAVAVRVDDGEVESCDPVPLGVLDLPDISDDDVEIRVRGVVL